MNKFNKRSFVSISLAISFLVMTITGLVLYIMPHGRVAYWIHWTLFGLSKDQWAAVHTIFSYIFITLGLFHILAYNIRPLLNYIKEKVTRKFVWKRELLLSLGLVILITVGTIINIPPFSTVMDLGGAARDLWAKNEGEPPFPHAEKYSLRKLSEMTGIDYNDMITRLYDAGIEDTDPRYTLNYISKEYKTTPDKIYLIMQGKTKEKQK